MFAVHRYRSADICFVSSVMAILVKGKELCNQQNKVVPLYTRNAIEKEGRDSTCSFQRLAEISKDTLTNVDDSSFSRIVTTRVYL